MRTPLLSSAIAIGSVLTLSAPQAARPQSDEIAPAANEPRNLPGKTGGEAPIDPSAAAVAEFAGSGNPLRAIPLSRLSATRDRPLFSASRRPPPVAAAIAPPPPPPISVKPAAPEAPPFALVGTIIGDSDRIGIFVNETTKITTRIREGERDSGWTLRSLDPRSAVLEGEGRMVTLDLPQPTGSGAVAATPGGGARISGVVRTRGGPRDNADGL